MSTLSAKEIIHCHKNPINPNVSFGQKIFISENTENETIEVKKSLQDFKDILSFLRVERRHVRIKAEWLPDLKTARVIKKVGNIPSCIGNYKKGTLYLRPEEALFLLEMNRLELSFYDMPFSIEQAYKVLLDEKNSSCTLEQYRVYQNLILNGFQVKNYSDLNKIKTNEKATNKKRKFEDIEGETANKEQLSDGISENINKEDNSYCIINCNKATAAVNLKLKLQKTSDELNFENISTDNSPVLTTFSGIDSVAYYQLQEINFNS